MSITVQDAANIINYLYAAQAITVTDNQHAVWADYLNAEIPELQPKDIPLAARRAIKDWAETGRRWKIDVHQFALAYRAIRGDRVRKAGYIEAPYDLDSDEGSIYQAAYRYAIAGGATKDEADTFARNEVGKPAPATPPQLTGPPPTLEKFINKIKETA